ncbi:hypothetical protein AB0E69_36960 [Kribbella sp. NPDC026611]|uniref:hypothetical protein n=1 Tax=Kribbella sp. NPDC026611 TaxID=3154911 RepID=UPI0033D4AA00
MASLNSLLRLGPALAPRNTAVRSAVCVVLAVGVGSLAGQPLFGIVGSLGALAALYAGGSALQAARVVALVTLGLAVSVLVGASTAGHPWLGVVVVGVWALIVTLVCELVACPLPGRLMFVLVAAVGIGLPSGNTGRYALVVLATGAVAVVLTALDQWRTGAPAIPAYHWLLTATEAALADRSQFDELRHARERAAVVTRSTDAERRAVREAAAAWDTLDARAEQLAQDVIAGSRSEEELAAEVRQLSVAVDGKDHG